MKKLARREFLKTAVCAGGCAMFGGCANGRSATAPAIAGSMAYGALLHLGCNMWGDWTHDASKIPSSPEEEAEMHPGLKPDKNGVLPHIVRNYLRTDETLWRDHTVLMKNEGLNLLVMDIGEAYAYPSHPELWVNGSWSPEKLSAELSRIRKLGLEPVPKLNFSTGHDQWLKEYHYQTSTKKYYAVVADLIRDIAEVFGNPRYFHIGFDEEIPVALSKRSLVVCRQGELWWHDLFYVINQVEKHGARAMMWSDKICGGREEFLKRMTKGALQMPWYYGADFSESKLKWNPELEKMLYSWKSQENLAASILELDKAGFDMIPCTSNWSTPEAANAMLSFARKRLDPSRVKGFLTAPWGMTYREEASKVSEGIKLFAEAKRKHCT